MKQITSLSAALATLVVLALSSAQAGTVVYDNLSTTVLAAFSQPNADSPIFGDSLTLTQGGTLRSISLTLYNSSSGGNTGTIQQGTFVVNFYDNSAPYGGGTLSNPLLGTATFGIDLTGVGGLPAGYYTTYTQDIFSYGIVVPTEVLVTQQFTQTAGDSLRQGVLLFSDAIIGSSPNTVYIKSASTTEGLYTFAGNPGQFGYTLEVEGIPEPTAMMVLIGGSFGILLRRRRHA